MSGCYHFILELVSVPVLSHVEGLLSVSRAVFKAGAVGVVTLWWRWLG